MLSVDGASNIKIYGVGIIFEGPGDIVIGQALKFRFTASNNQAKYEALIACMSVTLEMGATIIKAKSESKLVANQVSDKYQANEPPLIKCLHKVQKKFLVFPIF